MLELAVVLLGLNALCTFFAALKLEKIQESIETLEAIEKKRFFGDRVNDW